MAVKCFCSRLFRRWIMRTGMRIYGREHPIAFSRLHGVEAVRERKVLERDALPEVCRQPAGKLKPVVDPARCEAKAACEAVCPVDVFEIVRIPRETFRKLPAMAKLKVWVHGMKTAETPNASACLGCALCVQACPEKAIRLVAADR